MDSEVEYGFAFVAVISDDEEDTQVMEVRICNLKGAVPRRYAFYEQVPICSVACF